MMWDKVCWLFILVTLAFWMGCSGDPGARMAAEHEVMLAEAGQPEAEAVMRSSTGGPNAGYATASRLTLERDEWRRTVVQPERGIVAHWPVYYDREFGDRTLRYHEDRGSALTEDGQIAAEAEAALDAEAPVYGGGHGADALVGPFKFAFDTAMLPVRMFQTPPWRIQHTPEQ